MDPYRAPAAQQFTLDPAFDAGLGRRGPERCAPTRDPALGAAREWAPDLLAKRRAQLALRVDKTDDDGRVPRIDLVDRIRRHQDGAAPRPLAPGLASDEQRPPHRHHQLDRVMAMRCGCEPGAPHDHRGGPDERTGRRMDQQALNYAMGCVSQSTLAQRRTE